MNINFNKSSELFIGFGDINKHIIRIGTRHNIGSLIYNRVGFYKLLGVILQDNLRWNEHVSLSVMNCFVAKLSRRRVHNLVNNTGVLSYLRLERRVFRMAVKLL